MKYFIFVVVLCVPLVAHADVRITEIAWMGTVASQYSEWFELYNDSTDQVDLAGWKLVQSDGSVIFTMTKTIDADGYLLVERTTASAPDAVPGINDEAGAFGASGFANTGEDLVLKDAGGASQETLNFASGWPAGDAATKDTMQWDGSRWITSPATPDAPTIGSDTGTGSNSTTNTSSDMQEKDPFPIPPVSPNQPHIEFVIPKTVYVGISYGYKARPVFEYNHAIDQGVFDWNMGDGTLYYQHEFVPLVHTYRYPGTYTISFVYHDPVNANNTLSGLQKIIVTAPAITLAIKDHKAIEFKNTSTVPIDMTGWKIASTQGSVDIPAMTILAERATIDIPFTILSFTPSDDVSLIDPSGTVVTSSVPVKVSTLNARTEFVDDAPYESPDLSDMTPPVVPSTKAPIANRTKTIVFGAVALFVIGLSILLERVMAQQEYLSQKE